ncbi:Glycyl-glycine endopeptidase LytM precursor [Planctomycetes bacterium Pan216]|uniref:Glycyl-glycine endopeptidase LytM n=1 Tax=Kolteria novifilia TaxID=2527975 RepID=A0A518B7V8_9BACT|nr:Glycyl-glycine endopeptidase LytM precursor [Planctomycetes bacterium Pan216]
MNCNVLPIAAGLLTLGIGASMSRGESSEESIQFTPVAMKVMKPPIAVKGSDGRFHVVYELKLANASPITCNLERLAVLTGDGKEIATYVGEKLAAITSLLGGRDPVSVIGAHQMAVVWMHLSFAPGSVPKQIEHELTIGSEKGTITEKGGESEVSDDVITLGPPLEGERWVAVDSCCESLTHRRALMGLNGHLYLAQRFAIDWEQLNDQHRTSSGDLQKVESYSCYGKRVFAVADAEVVAAVDEFQNQVPGGLPGKLPPEEIDGNHIILKLANGPFALYAHLKPGSLRVKSGQRVKRGEVIAQVGNTGNTSAPHLHFHVMSRPSALGSNGIPYVIDAFEVTGIVPSIDTYNKMEDEGGVVPVNALPEPRACVDELPMQLSVVHFPTIGE